MTSHTSTYSITPRARNHKGNAPTLPKTKYCTMCPAQFTRTTHLNRHIRSHTNERCHRCQTCGAEFTRSDLLARHRKTCREANNGAPRSRRRSCQSCVRSKVKCDLLQPCSRCASHGKACTYLNNPEEFRHRKSATLHSGRAQALPLVYFPSRWSADVSRTQSSEPSSFHNASAGRRSPYRDQKGPWQDSSQYYGSGTNSDSSSYTQLNSDFTEQYSVHSSSDCSEFALTSNLTVPEASSYGQLGTGPELFMQDLQSHLHSHNHWQQLESLSVNLDIAEFLWNEKRSSHLLEIAGSFSNHVQHTIPNANKKAMASAALTIPRAPSRPILYDQAGTSHWHPSPTVYERIPLESQSPLYLASNQHCKKPFPLNPPVYYPSPLHPVSQLQNQLHCYGMYASSLPTTYDLDRCTITNS